MSRKRTKLADDAIKFSVFSERRVEIMPFDFSDPGTQQFFGHIVNLFTSAQDRSRAEEIAERHRRKLEEMTQQHLDRLQKLHEKLLEGGVIGASAATGAAVASNVASETEDPPIYSKYLAQVQEQAKLPVAAAKPLPVSVGCIPCTQRHLSVISTALQDGDVELAREEMAALLNYDLTPEKLAATPETDRKVLEKYAKRIEELNKALSPPVPEIVSAAGSVHESIRFAREDGVDHPEVVKRLVDASDNVNAVESIRLSPTRLHELPEDEQEKVRSLLPKLRDTRQKLLNDIRTPVDLEFVGADLSSISAMINGEPDETTVARAAAHAKELNQSFRADLIRAWSKPGVKKEGIS
jgi:hypothetical protein